MDGLTKIMTDARAWIYYKLTFEPFGTTKKSDFLDKLEGLTGPEAVLRTVKDVDSIVFDGMAVIQMLPVPTSVARPTYDDMASLFWKHVMRVTSRKQVRVLKTPLHPTFI